MKIYNVKCFGIDDYSGNEAVVIQDSNLNITTRQIFAQNHNKSVCVFVDCADDGSLIKMDYYYPHKRSPLCLHGTLAAAHIYFVDHSNLVQLNVITSMTNQRITVKKIDNNIFLTVGYQHVDPTQIKLDNELISKFLNIELSIDFIEYYIASCGSPKLFIELPDVNLLYALMPNLELINEWSSLNKLNGLYVYCKLSENSYSGRNINHVNPELEDSATGAAAAAMTYHFKKDLIVYQGYIIGNECVMYTRFLGDHVQISGRFF